MFLPVDRRKGNCHLTMARRHFTGEEVGQRGCRGDGDEVKGHQDTGSSKGDVVLIATDARLEREGGDNQHEEVAWVQDLPSLGWKGDVG